MDSVGSSFFSNFLFTNECSNRARGEKELSMVLNSTDQVLSDVMCHRTDQIVDNSKVSFILFIISFGYVAWHVLFNSSILASSLPCFIDDRWCNFNENRPV